MIAKTLKTISLAVLVLTACRKGDTTPSQATRLPSRALIRDVAGSDGVLKLAANDGDPQTTFHVVDGERIQVRLLTPITRPVVRLLGGDAATIKFSSVTADFPNPQGTSLSTDDTGGSSLLIEGGDLREFAIIVSGEGDIGEVEVLANGRRGIWETADGLASDDLSADPSTWTSRAVPDHATLAPAGSADADPTPATCSTMVFQVPLDPRSLGRAVLSYKATNLTGAFSLVYSVNGNPRIGGLPLPTSGDLRLYTARLPVHQLIRGPNRLDLCGSPEGARLVRVQDVRVILESRRGILDEPEDVGAPSLLLDGESTTTVEGGRVIDLPVRNPGILTALLLAHDDASDGTSVRVAVDGMPVEHLSSYRVPGGTLLRMPATTARQVVSLDLGAFGGHLQDVQLSDTVTELASTPELVMDQPHQGTYFDRFGVVSGHAVWPTGVVEAATIVANGEHLAHPVEFVLAGGAFAMVLTRDALSEGPEWWVDLKVQLPSGPLLQRRVHFTPDGLATQGTPARATSGTLDRDTERQRYGLVGDTAAATVTPSAGGQVFLGERVRLTVPPGAVSRDVELSITRPSERGVHSLNPGMVNVTAPSAALYRFLPSGSHFATPVNISLPYAPTLIPAGHTSSDVHTYFFDEAMQKFVPLERVLVDTSQQTVESLTDHFTDMLNAVIVQPEAPTPQEFNPNSAAGLAVANPATNMTLIQPPTPRQDGSAVLTYPFTLPVARGAFQPSLGLTYSSEGGWGTAGEGWSTPVSTIEVDTRFGVPRYEHEDSQIGDWAKALLDAPPPKVVGERYLLDGAQLVPTNDVLPGGCSAGGSAQFFRLRREGRFARIVRCGDRPWNFYWEVTDKNGVMQRYGTSHEGRISDIERGRNLSSAAKCNGDERSIGRWLLQEVLDADGNRTTYRYMIRESTGIRPLGGECCYDNSAPCPATREVPWTSRYLQTIEYTKLSNDDHAFEVRLNYQSRAEGDAPADVQVNAKLGFKVKQDLRLYSVQVKCRGEDGGVGRACETPTPPVGGDAAVIREYVMRYDDPVDGGPAQHLYKTLLFAVDAYPAGGARPGVDVQRTSFTYGKAEMTLGDVETWDMPEANQWPLSMSVSGSLTVEGGAGLALGAAVEPKASGPQLSAQGSANGTISASLVTFADLNGDGLPDQIIAVPNSLFGAFQGTLPFIGSIPGTHIAFNRGRQGGQAGRFMEPSDADVIPGDGQLRQVTAMPPVLGFDLSGGLNVGANVFMGPELYSVSGTLMGDVGLQGGFAFPTDINGDGLLDFAGPVNVVQQRDSAGNIFFGPDEFSAAGLADCTLFEASDPAAAPDAQSSGVFESVRHMLSRNQNHDAVLRWRAPRDGNVRIHLDGTPLIQCVANGEAGPAVQVIVRSTPLSVALTELPIDSGIRSPLQALGGAPGAGMPNIDDILGQTNLGPLARLLEVSRFDVQAMGSAYTFDLGHDVAIYRGGEIYLRVTAGATCADAELGSDPLLLYATIMYTDGEHTSPVATNDNVFSNFADFRTVGSTGPLHIPAPGNVRITGSVHVVGPLADDVHVELLHQRCGVAPFMTQAIADAEHIVGDGFPLSPSNYVPTALTRASQGIAILNGNLCETLGPPMHIDQSGRASSTNTFNLRSPADDATFEIEELDVLPGDKLIVQAVGQSPIDPASIVFSPVTLQYTQRPARDQSLTDVLPLANDMDAVTGALVVPTSVTWRRLAPMGGSYNVVHRGSEGVAVNIVGYPPAWVASGGRGAHVVVQQDGNIVMRAALSDHVVTPNFCPFTPLKEMDTGCPSIAAGECYKPASTGIRRFTGEVVRKLLECGATCGRDRRGNLTCTGGLPDIVLCPSTFSNGFNPCDAVPALCNAGRNLACNIATCVPNVPGCDIASRLSEQGCNVPQCDIPFPGLLPIARIDVSGLGDGDALVSLEPPDGAMLPLLPESWDAQGWAAYWANWIKVPDLAHPLDDPRLVWAQTEAFAPFSSLLMTTQLNGGVPQTSTVNLLLPDGTFDLPIPVPIQNPIGLTMAEGYRGWSYGEWTGSDLPTSLLSLPQGVVANIAALNPATAFPNIGQSDHPVNVLSDPASIDAAFPALGVQNTGTGGPSNATSMLSDFMPLGGKVSSGDAEKRLGTFKLLTQLGTGPAGAGGPTNMRPLRPQGPTMTGQMPGIYIRGPEVSPGKGGAGVPPPPNGYGIPDYLGAEMRSLLVRLVACPRSVPKVNASVGVHVGGQVLMVGARASATASIPVVDYRDMTGDGIPDAVISLGGVEMLVLRTERGNPHGVPFVPLAYGIMPQAVTASADVGVNGGASTGGSSPHCNKPGGRACVEQTNANAKEGIALVAQLNGGITLHADAAALIDINGDGLPDSVRQGLGVDCQGLVVRLNLGDRLSPEEDCWFTGEGAGPIQQQLGDGIPQWLKDANAQWLRPMGFGLTLSVGGQLALGPSFAKGNSLGAHINPSLSQHTQHEMLLDMNGDGLPDRVSMYSDRAILVNLNTGAGFVRAPTVFNSPSWGQSLTMYVPNQGPLELTPKAEAFVNGLIQNTFSATTCPPVPANIAESLACAVPGLLGPPDALSTSHTIAIGGGVGGGVAIPIEPGLFGTLNGGINANAALTMENAMLMDVDGDGIPEPVHLVKRSFFGNTLLVKPNKIGTANRLSSYTNPLGGTVELQYTRQGNTVDMPHSKYVLSKTVQRSGYHNRYVAPGAAAPPDDSSASADAVTARAYRYFDGKYDRNNREFLGFRVVRDDDVDPDTGGIIRGHCAEYETGAYAMAGLLTHTLSGVGDTGQPCEFTHRFEESSIVYLETQPESGVNDEAKCPTPAPLKADDCSSFAHLPRTTTQIIYEGDVEVSRTVKHTPAYDAVGNPTLIEDMHDELSGVPLPSDDLRMSVSYEPVDGAYLASLAHLAVVQSRESGSWTNRRMTEAFHDSRGHVTSYRQYVDQTYLETTYTYDPLYGTLETVTTPTGYHEVIHRDAVTHTLVASSTDNLGRSAAVSFDLRFGVPLSVTDSNGRTITTRYDDRGRTISVMTPVDVNEPALRMSYDCRLVSVTGPCATTIHATAQGAATGALTFQRVDGMGRQLWTAASATRGAEDGYAVTGRTRVDELGRPVLTGIAEFLRLSDVALLGGRETPTSSEPLTFPVFRRFDLRDRVTLLREQPQETTGLFRDTAFFFTKVDRPLDVASGSPGALVPRLLKEVVDANGERAGSIEDPARKLQLAVLEFPVHGGSAQETKYLYDAVGDLRFIRDAAQNQSEFRYDNLGRLTNELLPDTGETIHAWDAAGRPESTTDARGCQVRNRYEDASSRVVLIQRLGPGACAAPSFTFAYGKGSADATLNLVGRIKQAHDDDGDEMFAYDGLGNVSSRTKTIAVGSFTTDLSYDGLGRLQRVTYPAVAGTTVRPHTSYEYNNAGQVKAVSDALRMIHYNEHGQRTQLLFPNGAQQHFGYDPRTLRLTSLGAGTIDGSSFYQSDIITYDPVGNIKGITADIDRPATGIPTIYHRGFFYDAMHRLTDANGQIQYSNGSAKSYVSSWGFQDPQHAGGPDIHNLYSAGQNTSAEPIAGGGANTIDSQTHAFVYTYAPGRPHTLSRITNGLQIRDYQHDPAGFLRSVTIAQGSTRHERAMDWTADGRMVVVREDNVEVGRYGYDAVGNRVYKEAGVQKDHYLGPHATVTAHGVTRHVFLGSARVASTLSTGTVETSHFYLQDHIGSSNALLDDNGAVVEFNALYPYGAPLDTQQASDLASTQRFLFTGQNYDGETGYSYFNDALFKGGGRYLDHERSLWTSVDPEWHKQGAVGLNRFAPMAWNPLKLVDSDGRLVYGPSDPRLAPIVQSLKTGSKEFSGAYADLDFDPNYTVNLQAGLADNNFGLTTRSVPPSGVSDIEVNLVQHDRLPEEGLAVGPFHIPIFSDIKLIDTTAHELFHAKDQQRTTDAYRDVIAASTPAAEAAAQSRYQAASDWEQSSTAHREVRAKALIATGQAAFAQGPVMAAKYILSLPALVGRLVENP